MFVRLKVERQVYEVELPVNVSVIELYEHIAKMFYLSPKHIKIVHKGHLVTPEHLATGGDKAPLLQLIGRKEGVRTWKDEKARRTFPSCCMC
jgi:hypothetical protein